MLSTYEIVEVVDKVGDLYKYFKDCDISVDIMNLERDGVAMACFDQNNYGMLNTNFKKHIQDRNDFFCHILLKYRVFKIEKILT
jgi:hypothetical protein